MFAAGLLLKKEGAGQLPTPFKLRKAGSVQFSAVGLGVTGAAG
jgi:hypothetical protein